MNLRFNYRVSLSRHLAESVKVIPILNHTVMQGSHGAVANINMPSLAGRLSLLHLHICKHFIFHMHVEITAHLYFRAAAVQWYRAGYVSVMSG